MDFVQVHAGGIRFFKGTPDGGFAAARVQAVEGLRVTRHLACDDYDQDGRLDLMLVTAVGPRLLLNRGEGRFQLIVEATGELEYHSRSMPAAVQLLSADFNLDNRTDTVLVFDKAQAPALYFNRGFGSFGFSRNLQPKNPDLFEQGLAAAAWVEGQGGLAPGMVAVTAAGTLVWFPFDLDREAGPSILVRSAVPRWVAAMDQERALGARLARPGYPVRFGLSDPGPMILRWITEDGRVREEEHIAEEGQTPFTLP